MTTLDIERLRAHYHDVDPVRLPVLDDALRELADHILDDELDGSGLDGDVLASAWAVCVDELVVDVDLEDVRSTRDVAASWAHAILAALADAVDGTGGAAGVVVYRREVDALTDLVTAVAHGDFSRRWAWRQVHLIGARTPRPTAVDVAAAALARPSLLPAALAAAGPACRVLFGVEDWVRLAHSVATHIGSPSWSVRDPSPGPTDGGGRRATTSARAQDGVARPARRTPTADTWATVPDHVWAAVTDGRDRWSLAVLCQAVAGPHLTRDRSAIETIADHAPPAGRHRPATRGSDRADTREAIAGPGTPDERLAEAVISAWGGVWFLAHPLLELGVVDSLGSGPVGAREVPDALSAILVAVTGAPADDPSVLGLSGRGAEVPAWAPTPAQVREVQRWAATITSWLAERAGGRLVARRADVPGGERSLWRRTVTIETAPGWIEVTASLTDVDIDVRMAGLDLDPGFVWWLGAVVRFRYV